MVGQEFLMDPFYFSVKYLSRSWARDETRFVVGCWKRKKTKVGSQGIKMLECRHTLGQRCGQTRGKAGLLTVPAQCLLTGHCLQANRTTHGTRGGS